MKEMVNKNNIEDMIYEIRGVQVVPNQYSPDVTG